MDDVDYDGDLDPIVLRSHFRIVENTLPDDWILHHDNEISDSAYFYRSAMTDLDSDGDQDYIFNGWILGSTPDVISVGWLENLGYPEYRIHFITHVENIGTFHPGDLDNDGDIDFLTRFGPDPDLTGAIHLWLQQPDGTFEIEINTNIVGLRASNLADLNGDGWLDFLMATADGLEVHFGSADGWASIVLDPLPNGLGYVYDQYDFADFDTDGDLDFVTQRYYFPGLWFGQIAWWENEGGMSFSRHIILDNIESGSMNTSRPLRILDIELDGDMDVADGGLFFVNQGDNETFVQQIYEPDEWYDFPILEKADIDNDGDVDLFNEHVYWYENPTNDPPQFIIRLVPRQTTVPSAGGEVVFDGMVYNQFPQPINGHLWADVTGPNGNSARVWHRRMTFTNGEWLTWSDLGLTVPGGLPVGDYRMTVRAGASGYGFVPGDSLRFVVEGR
ncbi:VCBS repeat-containing protein [bacterium]|nr:VCBS repeat-containing protein [bacterium]